MTETAYQGAGVDIAAKMGIIERIARAVKATQTPQVLAGVGAFGGLFQLTDDLILVASTDGIGTKTALAGAIGRYHGLGVDIVNHCVNDILCQGARPLFFMDYIAASKLHPDQIVEVVEGMAEACAAAGCALLGGETAEMSGVYQPDQFDVAATIVGLVDRVTLLPTTDIAPGDVLLGLESSGPHTNGYSLIRRLFDPHADATWIDALIEPHRSYLAPVTAIRAAQPIKALAHITGGGFFDNIPRVLPAKLGVEIVRESWPIPHLFAEIARRGKVAEAEMFHVFNMGIGMVIIAAPEAAAAIVAASHAFPIHRIGSVTALTAETDARVILR